MNKLITTHGWKKQASIFDNDSRFEIYKTITKIYAAHEIYNVIAESEKQTLKTCEVWDDIYICFFRLGKLTLDFTPE